MEIITCAKGKLKVGRKLFNIPNITLKSEIIPRGHNGYVFQAFDNIMQRTVAVKVWINSENRRRNKIEQGLAEVRKISNLNYHDIINVYTGSILDNKIFYIVMEYLEGITLAKWLTSQNHSFSEIFSVWIKIYKSMKYAHNNNVYHGDLHLKNIIVNGENVKIIDFGTSTFVKDTAISKIRESKLFIELIDKLIPSKKMSTFIEIDYKRLTPEIILEACDNWMRLQESITKIEYVYSNRYENRDYSLRSECLALSHAIRETPIFNLSYCNNYIHDVLKEEEYYQWYLQVLYNSFIRLLDKKTFVGDGEIKQLPFSADDDTLMYELWDKMRNLLFKTKKVLR